MDAIRFCLEVFVCMFLFNGFPFCSMVFLWFGMVFYCTLGFSLGFTYLECFCCFLDVVLPYRLIKQVHGAFGISGIDSWKGGGDVACYGKSICGGLRCCGIRVKKMQRTLLQLGRLQKQRQIWWSSKMQLALGTIWEVLLCYSGWNHCQWCFIVLARLQGWVACRGIGIHPGWFQETDICSSTPFQTLFCLRQCSIFGLTQRP